MSESATTTRCLTDGEIGHAREVVERIHPLAIGETLREHLMAICDIALSTRAELNALREATQ